MKSNKLQLVNNFVIFETESGKVNVDVYFQNDTLWLTQKTMSILFEKDRSVISKHLKNIFTDGELEEKMVCAKYAYTTQHGAIEGKTQTNKIKQ